MKRNFVIAAALLSGFATTSIMANQATLMNTSPEDHPLTVVYQMAYKNDREPVVFGHLQTIQLNEKAITIPFDMHGYQLAGIVPISIDGKTLPSGINEFDKPARCSLTTDKLHNSGVLAIAYSKLPHGHAKLTCAIHGGIFG